RATKNRNKRPISYTHINREESLTCKGIVCSVRGFLHSIIGKKVNGKRQRKLLFPWQKTAWMLKELPA
ncbi:MAG: hypothetical protein ACLVB0_09460, partial [Fusicatenibacter saccharivorans]